MWAVVCTLRCNKCSPGQFDFLVREVSESFQEHLSLDNDHLLRNCTLNIKKKVFMVNDSHIPTELLLK